MRGGSITVGFDPKMGDLVAGESSGGTKNGGARLGEFTFDIKKGKKGAILKESLVAVA